VRLPHTTLVPCPTCLPRPAVLPHTFASGAFYTLPYTFAPPRPYTFDLLTSLPRPTILPDTTLLPHHTFGPTIHFCPTLSSLPHTFALHFCPAIPGYQQQAKRKVLVDRNVVEWVPVSRPIDLRSKSRRVQPSESWNMTLPVLL